MSSKLMSSRPAASSCPAPRRRSRRGRQAPEACGDIHTVAEDVAVLGYDDLADVDANPEFDPFRCRQAAVVGCHQALRSLAQRPASITLANSISSPSPVVLTRRR